VRRAVRRPYQGAAGGKRLPRRLQFRLRALRLPPARSVATVAVYAGLRHDPCSAAVHAAAHPGTASFCTVAACRCVAWRADAAARGSRRGAGHLLVRRGLLVREGGAADRRGAGEEAAPAGGGGEGVVADARGRRAGRREGGGGRRPRGRAGGIGRGRSCTERLWLWRARWPRGPDSANSGGGVARRREGGCAFARGARVWLHV